MPDNIDDPITMYIVVREELDMGVGKVAAQCCHACQKVLIHYFKALAVGAKLHGLPNAEAEHIATITRWLANGSRKIILRANEESWGVLKGEKDVFTVADAGLTEGLEAGTETCIAFFPQYKSKASPIIKGLSALR